MADRPTIIQFAEAVARAPGIEAPTPLWAATLRLLYGLPLAAADVALLVSVTGRTPDGIRAHEGKPFDELWARVGRRGRKSATAAVITLFEALYGGHEQHLMPGEVGLIPTISKDLSGAALIRRFQHLFLDALEIAHSDTKFGAVEVTLIEGTPITLACLTCTSESPRGLPVPVAICDEIAFWATSERYSQPDSQILAALRPAMAQFPARKLVAISSPFGVEGIFHSTVEAALNDNEQTILAVQGPTWEWNPSITEERTHELERIESTWKREYAAIPSETLSNSFFDPDSIDRAFAKQIPSWFRKRGTAHVCLDASAGHEGGDGFAWAVFQYWEEEPLEVHLLAHATNENHCVIRTSPVTGEPLRRPDRPRIEPILRCEFIDVLSAPFYTTWPPSRIVSRIVFDGSRFNPPGTRLHCHADQFSEAALNEIFKNQGATMHYHPLTAPSKAAACGLLRQLFDSDTISINPNSPGANKLRSELKSFVETLTNGGTVRYEARRGHRDDEVSTFLQCALSLQSDNPVERIGWTGSRGVIREFQPLQGGVR
jgi:hypothetical protein